MDETSKDIRIDVRKDNIHVVVRERSSASAEKYTIGRSDTLDELVQTILSNNHTYKLEINSSAEPVTLDSKCFEGCETLEVLCLIGSIEVRVTVPFNLPKLAGLSLIRVQFTPSVGVLKQFRLCPLDVLQITGTNIQDSILDTWPKLPRIVKSIHNGEGCEVLDVSDGFKR